MKLLLKNHKAHGGKYNNENHGKLLKIFKILEADSLGFVQEYWSETFEPVPNTKDWLLELNTEPEWHKLEKILELKNVEEYSA